MEKLYIFKSVLKTISLRRAPLDAERWGPCWNACATRRTVSGVRTVRGRPEGFLLTMDAVVLNCVTQFNIVWRVGTFPFLPMSKCRRKTHSVTVVESLFLKNVSTANARCSSDERCVMTDGLNRSTQRRISPRHLQRCRHGAKFKSSNCFCPTLYELQREIRLKLQACETQCVVSLSGSLIGTERNLFTQLLRGCRA